MSAILIAIFGQRALFYGFRILLFTSLLGKFATDPHTLGQYYGGFISLTVLSPLCGGFLADKIGALLAARLGLVSMVLAALLAAHADSAPMFILALVWFALGYGVFDPAAVACVGAAEANSSKAHGFGFRLMFFCVNLGAFCAPLIVLLAGGLRAVWILPGLGALCLLAMLSIPAPAVTPVADSAATAPVISLRQALPTLVAVNLILAVFLAAFEQIWSTFLKVSSAPLVDVDGALIPASILVCLNPLLYMLLTPLSEILIRKYSPSTYAKLWIAVPLLALAFGFLGWGSSSALSVGMVEIVLFMLLLTVAEVLVLPTVYALASAAVGPRNRATKLGLMALGIGLGYFLSGFLSDFVKPGQSPTVYFYTVAAICLVGMALLLLFFRPIWTGKKSA